MIDWLIDCFFICSTIELSGYSTDGDRIDLETLVTYCLELLNIGLSDEDGKASLREDDQSLNRILDLVIDFAQLTTEQLETFREDGNEYVSKELDDMNGDNSVRFTSSGVIQELCKLYGNLGISHIFGLIARQLMQLESSLLTLFSSFASLDTNLNAIALQTTPYLISLCDMLSTLSPSVQPQQQQPSSSSLLNEYCDCIFKAESLLWALEVVGEVYRKHCTILRKIEIDVMADAAATAMSRVLASGRSDCLDENGEVVMLQKKHRIALTVVTNVPASQVKGFVWRMFQVFSSPQIADVVRGRMFLVFVALESVFGLEEVIFCNMIYCSHNIITAEIA